MAKNTNGRRKIKKHTAAIPNDFLIRHAKDAEQIFREAVAAALRRHKLLKNPVAVMKNGKVTLLQPEEL